MKSNVIKSDNKKPGVEIISSKKMISIIGAECAGRLFENMEQLSVGSYQKYHCLKGFLKKTSQKYMRAILPYALEDTELCADVPNKKTKIRVAYKYGLIFLDHQDYEKYSKELELFISDFFAESPEQTTDDTVFMMALVSTFLKFDAVYQLSCDKNDYKLVADDKNFANLTDNYTNEFFTDVSSVFTQTSQQYGELMQNIIDAVIYSPENSSGKKVDFAKLFKQAISNSGSPYAGKSWGNGSAMRMGPVAYVAQSFKQGWELSKLVVEDTHNHEESIKAARVVYTVGACSCYGLSSETIRKIIHFMFFDSNATGDLDGNCADLCNFGTMEHRKNLNGASLEDIRNCDRKQLEEDIKKYRYSERAKTTVTLAVRIALTAESTEEAMRWVLEAGGDCDTLGIIVADMITKRCGISKAYADRMTKISLKTEYDKAPMDKQVATDAEIRKNSQEPECIVERVNDKKEFTYYGNSSDLFDKKFGHHFREKALIERQLINILELMIFLLQYKNQSMVKDKDLLLGEIFKDTYSDIDFILNINRECTVNAKEPVKLNAQMGEKNIFELLADKSDEEVIKMIKENKNIHKQLLAELKTEYEQTIYDHAVATAKFETDMKNQKLKNLTKQNIENIKTEIAKINDFISNVEECKKNSLKPFVIQDYENWINQLKGKEEQEIQKQLKKGTDIPKENNKVENNTDKQQSNINSVKVENADVSKYDNENSNNTKEVKAKIEINGNNTGHNTQHTKDKEANTSEVQLQQNNNGKPDENLAYTNKTNTDSEHKLNLKSLETDAKDIKNNKTATSQMQQGNTDKDDKTDTLENNKVENNADKKQSNIGSVGLEDADVSKYDNKNSNNTKEKEVKAKIEINGNNTGHNAQHTKDKEDNTSEVQPQQKNNDKLNENPVNTNKTNTENEYKLGLQLLEPDAKDIKNNETTINQTNQEKIDKAKKSEGTKPKNSKSSLQISHGNQNFQNKEINNKPTAINYVDKTIEQQTANNIYENTKNDKTITDQVQQKQISQDNKYENDKNQVTDKLKSEGNTTEQYQSKKYLVWGFWTGGGVCVIVISPSFVFFSPYVAAAIAVSILCLYLIAMLILRCCTKQPDNKISDIASKGTIKPKLDEAREQAKENEMDITNEVRDFENESNKS